MSFEKYSKDDLFFFTVKYLIVLYKFQSPIKRTLIQSKEKLPSRGEQLEKFVLIIVDYETQLYSLLMKLPLPSSSNTTSIMPISLLPSLYSTVKVIVSEYIDKGVSGFSSIA